MIDMTLAKVAEYTDGTLHGGADPRRDNKALGI